LGNGLKVQLWDYNEVLNYLTTNSVKLYSSSLTNKKDNLLNSNTEFLP